MSKEARVDLLTMGEALLVLLGVVIGIALLASFDRWRRRRSDEESPDERRKDDSANPE